MDAIRELRRLKTLGDLIDFLKYFDPSMSRAVLARMIPEVTAHNPHPVSKGQVVHWIKGRRLIYPQQVRVIEQITADTMRTDADVRQDFIIKITIGTQRWHILAYAICSRCKKPKEIRSERTRICFQCRKKMAMARKARRR